MNPAVLLAIGAVAVLALAGRKKGNGGAAQADETETMPKPGPTEPPAAETEEQADNEAAFAQIAVEASQQADWAPVFFLGQQGIDEGVLGIDADGFAHATPGEWLSGWLTRVAYWGAYQNYGWPLDLPVQCILPETCPEDMLPVRDALLRMNAAVKAMMADMGIEDVRL
jgi:hypothetical protein